MPHRLPRVLSWLASTWWCLSTLLGGCGAEPPGRSLDAPPAQAPPAPPPALPTDGPGPQERETSPALAQSEPKPPKKVRLSDPPAEKPRPQPAPVGGAPPGGQSTTHDDEGTLGGLGLVGVGQGGGGRGEGLGSAGLGRGASQPKSSHRPLSSPDTQDTSSGAQPEPVDSTKLKDPPKEVVSGSEPPRAAPSAQSPGVLPEPEAQAEEAPIPDEPKPGQVMFNPPNRMRLGKAERVEVRVVQNTQTDLTQNLRGAGKPVVETHKVSQIMRVSLTGEKFEIVPLSELEQVVGTEDFTEWSFSVTPIESGHHPLHLAVTMVLDIPGRGEKAKTLPVIDRPIEVEVDSLFMAKAFAQENWEWLASGVLLPAAAWSAERVRRRRRRERHEDSNET